MLRTNNKRLHSNLWTLSHFLGSAFIMVLVFGICYYIIYLPHGAYTDINVQTTALLLKTAVVNLVFNSSWARFMPISQFIRYLVPWTNNSDPLMGMPYVFSISLDFVLWFNVSLWTLQLIVFVPDACFHWLEKKKED